MRATVRTTWETFLFSCSMIPDTFHGLPPRTPSNQLNDRSSWQGPSSPQGHESAHSKCSLTSSAKTERMKEWIHMNEYKQVSKRSYVNAWGSFGVHFIMQWGESLTHIPGYVYITSSQFPRSCRPQHYPQTLHGRYRKILPVLYPPLTDPILRFIYLRSSYLHLKW